MESRFQTSFIPKKPLEPVSAVTLHKAPLGLFFNLSIFIAIIMLLAAGSVFAYSKILDAQISSKQQSISNSQKQFDAGLVTQLTRLSDRITTAQTLLDNHIGFSVFFSLLGNDTLKAIQYTNFSYTYGSPNQIAVTMKGVAKDYSVVADQSEILSDAQQTNGDIQSPIFSDLNLDQNGNANFSFSALINPTLISYKANLEALQNQNQNAAGSSSPADTTSTAGTAAPAPAQPVTPVNNVISNP